VSDIDVEGEDPLIMVEALADCSKWALVMFFLAPEPGEIGGPLGSNLSGAAWSVKVCGEVPGLRFVR